MMRIASLVFGCLLLPASAGYAAETDGRALAEMMKQARYSEGFEARLNVLVTKANGAHPAPFKLAVVGQIAADKQRLSIRGISPDTVRDRAYVAERGSDGQVRGVETRASGEFAELNPNAKMFDSGLVVWDMFSPWWGWASQTLEGREQIEGRECLTLRSIADDESSAVHEVESCVDQRAKLALRTRLFDKRHALMRTTQVGQVMRKGESGALAAKKLAITDAARMLTNLEVYAGDEEYETSAATFAALDKLKPNEQSKTK